MPTVGNGQCSFIHIQQTKNRRGKHAPVGTFAKNVIDLLQNFFDSGLIGIKLRMLVSIFNDQWPPCFGNATGYAFADFEPCHGFYLFAYIAESDLKYQLFFIIID